MLGALVCVALPDVGTVVARAQEVSTADGPGQSGLANKSSEAMPAGAKRPAVTLPFGTGSVISVIGSPLMQCG